MGNVAKMFLFEGVIFYLGKPVNEEVVSAMFPGKKKVRRLSNIEFNETSQKWEVILNGSSEPVFQHSLRQACHEWEEKFFEDEFIKNPRKYIPYETA